MINLKQTIIIQSFSTRRFYTNQPFDTKFMQTRVLAEKGSFQQGEILMTQITNLELSDLSESINERINELEMKVIFQDDLLNTLNDIVIRQDKEIMKLWDANRLIKQSMQDIRSGSKDEAVDTPPPHY